MIGVDAAQAIPRGGEESATVAHVNDLVCFDPRPRCAESLRGGGSRAGRAKSASWRPKRQR